MTASTAIPDAIAYALKQTGLSTDNMCLFNPNPNINLPGDHFSYKFKCDLNTPGANYNTVCVFSTRQVDETLGLLAMAAAHTKDDGHIVIAQDNAHGATGLEKRIKQGFANVSALIKFKCRIWVLKRSDLNLDVMATWMQNAMIQPVMQGTYYSAPGLFSWDRIDVASKLLIENLPNISGIVGDFGCGYGYLSCALATNPNINTLYSIDLDYRAVECCKKNVAARNPSFSHIPMQADITTLSLPQSLDVIVMNPPFHTQTDEDHQLGQIFCERALKCLKKGGNLYLVANRHLPYEAVLKASARTVTLLADKSGFKVLHAQT